MQAFWNYFQIFSRITQRERKVSANTLPSPSMVTFKKKLKRLPLYHSKLGHNFQTLFSSEEKVELSSARVPIGVWRRSVLIVLIYFPLSPASAILNCSLNSFVGNATPRIQRFDNFCLSLYVTAATTMDPLYVYLLILLILFSSSFPSISSFFRISPPYYLFRPLPTSSPSPSSSSSTTESSSNPYTAVHNTKKDFWHSLSDDGTIPCVFRLTGVGGGGGGRLKQRLTRGSHLNRISLQS